MKFNVSDTLMLVCAYPDRYVAPEIFWWAQKIGLDLGKIYVYSMRHICAAVNTVIRNVALRSTATHFIFIDRDVRPDDRTYPMLESAADVVGAMVPFKDMRVWSEATAIHAPLWRTHRAVLTTLSAPWMEYTWSPDGTKLAQCQMANFRTKALAAGFTVERAGWAEHDSALAFIQRIN